MLVNVKKDEITEIIALRNLLDEIEDEIRSLTAATKTNDYKIDMLNVERDLILDRLNKLVGIILDLD